MADRRRQRRFVRHRRRKSRRGAVLVAVIVCVAVATVVFISIVKMAGAGRRTTRTETWRLQAAWLAESGLERAAWRLASDDTYSGEAWTVPAEELAGTDAGAVKIEVEAVPDDPSRRLVRVRADFPDHPRHRARHSKQAIVQLPVAEDAAGV